MFGLLHKVNRWRRDRRRGLFVFREGRRVRRVDPLAAFRAIHNDEEYHVENTPRLMEAGDDEAMAITTRMLGRAFGVSLYDETTGEGMTQGEALAMFQSFLWYIEDLKKNISPSPTSPESSVATSPDSNGESTSGTADSTCSSTAPDSAEQISSASE
jgi:hypothetical protein